MKNINNPYLRLQNYYIFFSNTSNSHSDYNSVGFTITELNEKTKIPKEIIRKDMIFIYKNVKYRPFILSADIQEDFFIENSGVKMSLEDLMNKIYSLKPNTKLFSKLILEGSLDNIPFILMEERDRYVYDIALKPIEYQALNYYKTEVQKDKKLQDKIVNFQIKDSYKFYKYYYEFDERTQMINNAINNDNCISIEYQNVKKEISSNTVKPLKIVYDSQENIYAILAIKDNKAQIYRLDRIISMMISNKDIKVDKKIIENILKKQPNVWGMDFLEKPTKVKVRFYNEYNVWTKVKKDLEYRTGKKLYEKDGYLYYEDEVCGINSFKKWIYSFGSSAIVVEPQSLRESIVDSLIKRKEVFE